MKFIKKLTKSVLRNYVMREIVAERVRIWNDIFESASIKPNPESATKPAIIFISEAKLKSIVIPDLPSWYKEPKDLPPIAPPEHPSVAAPKMSDAEFDKINNKNQKRIEEIKRGQKWLNR